MAVKLDAAQRAAAAHVDGPYLCIAGPGSGKTTVMIHRTKNLVQSGVDPRSILVLTFGKNAALELKERYQGLKGAKEGVVFSTIHSFAYGAVMSQKEFEGYSVLGGIQQNLCFKELLKQMDWEDFSNLDTLLKSLAADLSRYRELPADKRNNYVGTVFEEAREFQWFWKAYTEYKAQKMLIDFDDMLYLCRDLFDARPKLLAAYQARIRYLMVDEFQDTSDIQAEIIYRLAEPKNNLFVCGDEDQAIYEWRNAKPQLMLDFPKRFPGCGIGRLTTNYRSDTSIIDAAGHLISHNKVRFDKDIVGKSEHKGVIRVVEAGIMENPVIGELERLQKEGTPFYDMAVLTRTNREASGIAMRCFQNNIPFICKTEIQNPYQGPLFATILDYLAVIYGEEDWEHYKRIINKPGRYVKKDLIEQSKNLGDLYDAVSEKGNFGAKRAVRKFMMDLRKIQEYAKKETSLDVVMAKVWDTFDLKQYMESLCRYLGEDPDLMEEQYGALLSEMASVKKFQEFRTKAQIYQKLFDQKKRDANGVTITTMHRAKGLEWSAVLIPSCNEGNIPFRKRDEPFSKNKDEEERRLMYVAVTRAEESCVLFTDRERRMSRYLGEAGLDPMEQEGEPQEGQEGDDE